ncbi:hypothetical protein [Streptomyces sp. NPDC093094]|uniref:hypothetical protein n=1 Tax=Streptomyces sp. NPDC093094 TaxID=3366026 RepID=UPI00382CDF2B
MDVRSARPVRQPPEPLHAVICFAPKSREAGHAVGLRGFRTGCFAQRPPPSGAGPARRPLAGAPPVPVLPARREGPGHPAVPDLSALVREAVATGA